MQHTFKPTACMAVVLIVCTGLFSIAWQKNPANKTGQQQLDTLPNQHKTKEDKTVIKGDIDKAIEEVNRAKEKLRYQLANKNWEKMHRQLEESLEKIDPHEIHEQVGRAMKELDLQKIQLQVQASLKQIDWQKMQAEINKAQAEVRKIDNPQLQKEIELAMQQTKKAMKELKAVNVEKVQHQLERSREELRYNEDRMKEEMEKARHQVREHLKKDFRKEMEHARESVDRASAELQNYKDMLIEMDKEGLMKKDGPYKVEYNNGVLTIDGKTQPDTITNKYKHYFKNENVTIKKTSDDDDERTIDL